jgi:heme exporter protein A
MTGDSSSGRIPLHVQGIAHRFDRRWVLRGLDLRVNPGEVVAMIGANGAGKTTLLRIAATLLRPLRGRGWVGGASLRERPDRVRTKIGILGHSPALYEDLTPAENLRFALRMQGDPGDPERILSILDEVGLTDFADTRVRRFSTGMRRRVAVGRVLASLPHLLLMDEPYASLDPEGVELVNRTIQSVLEKGGGVLLATHDLHSGAGLRGRVVKLDRGLLKEEDGGQATVGRRDSSRAHADPSSPGVQEQLA